MLLMRNLTSRFSSMVLTAVHEPCFLKMPRIDPSWAPLFVTFFLTQAPLDSSQEVEGLVGSGDKTADPSRENNVHSLPASADAWRRLASAGDNVHYSP